MRKLLGAIFGNGKQAESVIDGAKKGLDAMFFTNEEKSVASKEAFKLWIEFQEATKGQNVARRAIALMVVTLWAFLVVLTIGVAIVVHAFLGGPIVEDQRMLYDVIFEIIQSFRVTEITLLIMGFYFGKHLVTNWVEAAKKK
jgi:hypothetical protein